MLPGPRAGPPIRGHTLSMLLLATAALAADPSPAWAAIPSPAFRYAWAEACEASPDRNAPLVGHTRVLLDPGAPCMRLPDPRALDLTGVPLAQPRLDTVLAIAPGAIVRNGRVVGFGDTYGYTLIVDGVRRR